MSCITENTIIIKTEDENLFLSDVIDCPEVSNPVRVFQNDKYTVYVYDCNGDGPWEIDASNMTLQDIPAIETNYGDSDGYWTRIKGKDDVKTLADHLIEFFPDDWEFIKEKIKYTF